MKTVIEPGIPEIAQYECDVSGVPLPTGPAAVIKISCGYGATYDGDQFELHLSAKAAEVVLPLLRSLLLDGAPLSPHLTDALFPDRGREEKHVTRRERAKLMGTVKKLCRYRRRILVTVKHGLAESGAGKTRDRGSFANYAKGPKPTAAQKTETSRRIAEMETGRTKGIARGDPLAAVRRTVSKASRRQRGTP